MPSGNGLQLLDKVRKNMYLTLLGECFVTPISAACGVSQQS
jgi:hypothetical protein